MRLTLCLHIPLEPLECLGAPVDTRTRAPCKLIALSSKFYRDLSTYKRNLLCAASGVLVRKGGGLDFASPSIVALYSTAEQPDDFPGRFVQYGTVHGVRAARTRGA